MKVNIYRGDLQACRVCLATDIKLISLKDFSWKRIYSEFSGLPIMATDGLPQHICVFCCALLKKSSKFKQKCESTYCLLREHLLDTQVLTSSYIKNIDRSHLRIPLNTTNVLECNCLPDETHSEDDLCKTEPTSDIEPADLDCFSDNSNMNNDASFENKHTEPDAEMVDHIEAVESTHMKDDHIDNSERIQSDDLKRIEDFKSKHFNKAMDSDKEAFYHYIFNKYLTGTQIEKNNDSNLNLTDDRELITIDNSNVDSLRTQVKHITELCNINQNVTRKRFYEYISSIYIDNNTSLTKRKIVKDIHKRMKGIKRNENGTITRESLEILCKELNFDVILMHEEEKIQDVLKRKESEKYKKAGYKCEHCFVGFAKENTFQNHKALHDPSLPYECEYCHVRFKNPQSRKNHLAKQHRYKFVCRQCGQVKRDTTSSREHYKSHSGFSYVCEHCGTTFDKYDSRANHVRIHHGSLSCDTCHMTFAGEKGLIVHKTKAHRELFKCPSCLVQFHNPNALRTHELWSPGGCGAHIRPCTQCGENINDETDLKRHIDRHHRKRPKGVVKAGQQKPGSRLKQKKDKKDDLICDICAKGGFRCKALLRMHQQRKHSDERPFICDYCKKTFKTKERLKVHMTIHTDERRYKCRRCLKAFRQHPHLISHMKTHSNEKPFACEICQNQFKYNASLWEHMRTVHEGLPPRKRIRRDK